MFSAHLKLFEASAEQLTDDWVTNWFESLEKHGVSQIPGNQSFGDKLIKLAWLHLDSGTCKIWFSQFVHNHGGSKDSYSHQLEVEFPFSWEKFKTGFREKWLLQR